MAIEKIHPSVCISRFARYPIAIALDRKLKRWMDRVTVN
jgi:hypothetical protein